MGHGKVVQLAGVTGVILWKYDYDAFGNEREIAGQDTVLDSNPFRYCGEYFDKETGSIYLRARYYSPVLGRFRTEDPIRSGLNWYAYASNNPVMRIDPSGFVDVHLRSYLNNTYGIKGENIVWNEKTRGATVTYNGITHTFYGNINSDPSSPSYGKMIVDDNIILNIFGSPTAPSFLTTIHYTVPSYVPDMSILAGKLDKHDSYLYDPQAKTISATSIVTANKLKAMEQEYNSILSAGMMSGGVKITGFTKHGLAQIIGRDGGLGVSNKALLDTIRNPVKIIQQGAGKVKVIGENAVVILNEAGEVITAWAKNKLGIR